MAQIKPTFKLDNTFYGLYDANAGKNNKMV